jgi:flagellar hook-length control protein FliK
MMSATPAAQTNSPPARQQATENSGFAEALSRSRLERAESKAESKAENKIESKAESKGDKKAEKSTEKNIEPIAEKGAEQGSEKKLEKSSAEASGAEKPAGTKRTSDDASARSKDDESAASQLPAEAAVLAALLPPAVQPAEPRTLTAKSASGINALAGGTQALAASGLADGAVPSPADATGEALALASLVGTRGHATPAPAEAPAGTAADQMLAQLELARSPAAGLEALQTVLGAKPRQTPATSGSSSSSLSSPSSPSLTATSLLGKAAEAKASTVRADAAQASLDAGATEDAADAATSSASTASSTTLLAGAGNAQAAAFGQALQAATQGAQGSPSPAAPPLLLRPEVGSREWDQALGQQLMNMSLGKAGEQTAELQLNPPGLGPLKITLNLSEQQISAVFVSAHASVRATLEAALPHLRSQLAESGISLGQASVDSGQQQPGHAGQASAEQHPGRRHDRALPGGDTSANAGLPPLATQRQQNATAAALRGRVDLYA